MVSSPWAKCLALDLGYLGLHVVVVVVVVVVLLVSPCHLVLLWHFLSLLRQNTGGSDHLEERWHEGLARGDASISSAGGGKLGVR